MKDMNRSSVRLRIIVALVLALGLAARFQAGVLENRQEAERHDDDAHAGKKHPHHDCVRSHPAGRARGFDKKCVPPRSSSGGTARGDFNGDGFADLAIGVPHEDIGTVTDAGEVIVIYGSFGGLATSGTGVPTSQVWHQNIALPQGAVADRSQTGDLFGAALAAGDFNGDMHSDLAVAVPGEIGPAGTRVGGVHVFYGSPDGLTVVGNQLFLANDFTQPAFPVFPGSGMSLVWADFTGDGIGDLAIEARGQDEVPQVMILLGSPDGLTTTNRALLTLPPSFRVFLEAGFITDLVLAAGDFNKNGRAELVVGAPLAAVDDVEMAGRVLVLFDYSPSALSFFTSSMFLDQNLAVGTDFREVAEAEDEFGASLAVGDFNGDTHLDLAVGVPFEAIDELTEASVPTQNVIQEGGLVHVFVGSSIGPTTENQIIHRFVVHFGGDQDVEPRDHIGAVLAAGNFDGDLFTDLAIGIPDEDVGNAADAGAVEILYGSATGLAFSQFWHEGSPGIGAVPTAADHFGASLSAWNFGRNHVLRFPFRFVQTADLAIGVPGKTLFSAGLLHLVVSDAGLVRVIYGSVNRLSATAGPLTFPAQVWRQGSDGVPDQIEKGDRFGEAVY